jgi:hypothetical protein
MALSRFRKQVVCHENRASCYLPARRIKEQKEEEHAEARQRQRAVQRLLGLPSHLKHYAEFSGGLNGGE